MIRREIYLDPKLEHRGFSGGTAHEDEFAYVIIGHTNDYNRELGYHDHLPVIRMCLRHDGRLLGIELIGGAEIVEAFKATMDKTNFVVNLILKNLTGEEFTHFLNESFKQGRRDGRNSLRREFQKLMASE